MQERRQGSVVMELFSCPSAYTVSNSVSCLATSTDIYNQYIKSEGQLDYKFLHMVYGERGIEVILWVFSTCPLTTVTKSIIVCPPLGTLTGHGTKGGS